MRTSWRSMPLLAFSIVAIARIGLAAPTVVLRYDPDKPNRNSAVIWLGYLVSRTAFHKKHHLPIPGSGEIIPSFEEEVDARTTAARTYREFKAKDAKIKDSYWETLSEIERRGFVAAYAWTFLHRKEWPSSVRPANLAEFNAWKQRALPRHVPRTYGWLEAGKS
jgi:hypothetical protein